MTGGTFSLEIEAGDDTTADDLAGILTRVASRISAGWPGEDIPATPGTSAPIRDDNGNRIGAWSWSA